MTENHRIKAVLFDLGSTLCYFDGQWQEVGFEMNQALVRALQDAGYKDLDDTFALEYRLRVREYQDQEANEFREFTMGFILNSLIEEKGYPPPSESTIASVLRAMFTVSQAHWKPEADTIPTLETLRQQGYRLAIVSNAGDDADVQAIIDNAGIREYFDFIITSAAAGVRKPNPQIFDIALQALGVRPQQAVMVGDTLGADILGAHNAGLPGIWISRRASPSLTEAHAGTIIPDAEIKTLEELPKLLEHIH
jgi:2-haloalkanoic acid dehalogenase type II